MLFTLNSPFGTRTTKSSAKLAAVATLTTIAAALLVGPAVAAGPTESDKATAVAEKPVNIEMITSKGRIQLELYPDKAPKSVANFVQYANDKFFDDTIFHRVINGFMLQGGGFNGKYIKKNTRDPIENEADNGLANERGTIAMARTADPHSATAQFFINHRDNDFLDHQAKTARYWGYAVFGKVTDGMDVVDAIANVQTASGGPFGKDVPTVPVVIESVSVIE